MLDDDDLTLLFLFAFAYCLFLLITAPLWLPFWLVASVWQRIRDNREQRELWKELENWEG